ncbi:protein kinase family protein [Nocardioides sp.]|uniref:protein kinase family protein n=1 Tax=Nocardioides sp. TaxID=35761 RepID=UPI002ED01229
MPQSASRGDVLADRYRLDDLLSESGNGRFWRAHDRVLDRPVALHCIAADDPRAERLTEAARLSATVLEPRILRVLDADRRDGMVYVVNEWGSGTSLDIMVTGDGPLPPRRAAWVVSEVASSMAAAHAKRIPHGRLVPENVLIDQAGSVRLIGFCVDAALHGLPAGELSEDVTDIGGLLYFLLTGKWAGQSPSAMPPALRDHDRLLRPRQVRAGIPRLLDSLCDHVLDPYAAPPAAWDVNLHTARGIAEALRDYVGDPTGLIEPAPLNGIRGGGVLAVPERRPEPPADPATEPTRVVPAVGAEPPPLLPPETGSEPADDPSLLADQGPLSAPTTPTDVPTQAGMPIFDDATDDVSWLERRSEPPPPPPAFEDPPERPLFAPEPPEGAPVRRPRPGAASQTGDYWPWDRTGPNTGSGVLPVTEADPDAEEVPGRSWLRLAFLIAAALLLLLALVVAYNLGRGKTPLGAEPEPDPSDQPSETAGSLTPITGTTASDFDPQGDPPEEYPDLAALAVDGDPETVWRTETYFDQFGPGGLKTGVGLTIDLGGEHEVSEIDLTVRGAPTSVSYFLTDTQPSTVADLSPVEEVTLERTRVRTRLDEPASGQYLVVWLTALPEVDGGYRGEIAEIVVSE